MNAQIKQDYDVAIVGAGPTGVVAANLLGRYGLRTLIVDESEDIMTIPRAVGMCEEGSRILDAAGLTERTAEKFHVINNIFFLDKHMQSRFHADADWRKDGYRAIRMFHQPELESCMREALKDYSDVDLFTSTALLNFDDDGKEVHLTLRRDNEDLVTKCRFLLACDGARSTVRKALNIGFSGSTYPQDWLILDIENNPLPGNDIAFSINPQRPAVTLPGPNSRRRWEFVIKEGDNVEEIFDEKNLVALLEPWGDMSGIRIERKAIYTFHARTAENFQKGNVFLLGDAAHITPPFAGQGMMAGLRDAHNLCWKLKGVIDGRLSRAVLVSYSTERVPQSRQIINFAQFVGSIILPQKKLQATVRDALFKLLGLLGVHSEYVGVPLRKLPNHINGGLLRHTLVSHFKKTGIELPQFDLESPCGKRLLADQMLGSQFKVIGWNTDPSAHLSIRTIENWQAMGGELTTLTSHESFTTSSALLLDRNQRYREIFGAGRRLIVIRPDKMIVINCPARKLDERLSRYIESLNCSAQGT
jgi:3-(3-hydroxy-phenyl)propionate hydroxylase